MSYQEKRTIVGMISMALLLLAYGVWAVGKYRSGAIGMDDTRSWALAILVFVGVGAATTIIIQIVFHILLSAAIAARANCRDDKAIDDTIAATMAEDEMDRLIELKSSRIGFACAGIGFVAALVAATMACSAAVMLNILFLSFVLGSLIESLFQLSFYRKGIRNG